MLMMVREVYDYLREQERVLNYEKINVNTKMLRGIESMKAYIDSEYKNVLNETINEMNYVKRVANMKGKEKDIIDFDEDGVVVERKETNIMFEDFYENVNSNYDLIYGSIFQRLIIDLLLNKHSKTFIYNTGMNLGDFDFIMYGSILYDLRTLKDKEIPQYRDYTKVMYGFEYLYVGMLLEMLEYKREHDLKSNVEVLGYYINREYEHGLKGVLERLIEEEDLRQYIKDSKIIKKARNIFMEEYEERSIVSYAKAYLEAINKRAQATRASTLRGEEFALLLLMRAGGNIEEIKVLFDKHKEEDLKDIATNVILEDLNKLQDVVEGRGLEFSL